MGFLLMARKKRQPINELAGLLSELRELTTRIASADAGDSERVISRLRGALDGISTRLSAFSAGLDPVIRPLSLFDPADPRTAGRIVALTLVAQERLPLANIRKFYGAGIYAIYYVGDFAPYAKLSGVDHPLYVGKADPGDPAAKDAVSQGIRLWGRLHEHAKSIGKTSTLNIDDFQCRHLIVQTGYQKSAEDYLIDFFKPIWNKETKICFGIGKHGDSVDTRANNRSPWDTLHPGREWADATENNQKSQSRIVGQIQDHLVINPPYTDIHHVFDNFLADMRQVDCSVGVLPSEEG